MDILIAFIAAVAAGVASHYIIQWIDKRKKNS